MSRTLGHYGRGQEGRGYLRGYNTGWDDLDGVDGRVLGICLRKSHN